MLFFFQWPTQRVILLNSMKKRRNIRGIQSTVQCLGKLHEVHWFFLILYPVKEIVILLKDVNKWPMVTLLVTPVTAALLVAHPWYESVKWRNVQQVKRCKFCLDALHTMAMWQLWKNFTVTVPGNKLTHLVEQFLLFFVSLYSKKMPFVCYR